MLDDTMIIEALDNIDDSNLERFLEEKRMIAGAKTKALVKRIVMIAAGFVILVSAVVLLPKLIKPGRPLNNVHSTLKLYCHAGRLFFKDTANGSGLMVYDPNTNEVQTLINETSGDVFIYDNGIYYYNTTGLYFFEPDTENTKQIMSFLHDRVSVSAVNGQTLFETPIEEQCTDFVENGNVLYFVYRAGKQLCTDERTEIGQERWDIIYALENDELTEIASTHFVVSYLHENPFQTDRPDTKVLLHDGGWYYLHVYDNRLFYLTDQCELHRMDPDSHEEVMIFSTENPVCSLFWNDERVYIAEQDAFQTVFDLKERAVVSRNRKETELLEVLSSNCVFYPEDDVFYSVYKGSIVRYSFEEPENFMVVHTLSEGINISGWINIAISEDKLYFSCNDPVNPDADWKIYRINNGTEEMLIEGNNEKTIVEKKE